MTAPEPTWETQAESARDTSPRIAVEKAAPPAVGTVVVNKVDCVADAAACEAVTGAIAAASRATMSL